MATNNPPKLRWIGWTMPCGTQRTSLEICRDAAGYFSRTPFFIDTARTTGHRCYGEKHGLHGAGMGTEVRCTDGSTYRIAATLGFGPRIAPLKAKAERLALEN